MTSSKVRLIPPVNCGLYSDSERELQDICTCISAGPKLRPRLPPHSPALLII